jgi:cell division septal protein FtsQ
LSRLDNTDNTTKPSILQTSDAAVPVEGNKNSDRETIQEVLQALATSSTVAFSYKKTKGKTKMSIVFKDAETPHEQDIQSKHTKNNKKRSKYKILALMTIAILLLASIIIANAQTPYQVAVGLTLGLAVSLLATAIIAMIDRQE